jgi:hypothetical protein
MFHRMSKGDGLFLAGLFLFSALGFLIPDFRAARFLGVAVFGWWMAVLMFFGPLIALVRIAFGRRGGR